MPVSLLRFCFVLLISMLLPIAASAEEVEAPSSTVDQLNSVLGDINGFMFKNLFFDVSFGSAPVPMPFLVVMLALGAIFFTVYHRFINVRGFRHAVQIVRGKHSNSDERGEVTPFRALTSALSATVGLGNIAGVAVAMVKGGPGALLWMMVLGFFGMSAKFHESTLAQMYRTQSKDGQVFGGPMFYLSQGLKDTASWLAAPGKILAIIFAAFCVMASLGGGNMFQSNQAFEGFFSTFVQSALVDSAPEEVAALKETLSYGFGLILAGLVAVVVIGGITRIGAATSRIVPFMGILYVLACLVIIMLNITEVPGLIGEVFSQAFTLDSAYGGLIGVLIIGFQRAAFSSESGLGSSAIAHSAAKTDIPVKEGFVASLEPFIDTIVVCFMTGMVVLLTGAYQIDALKDSGSAVTLYAFEQSQIGFFQYVLAVCIMLFAFSTMLSWCYYGERAWGYLFGVNRTWLGLRSIVYFRAIFVVVVFMGAVMELGPVIDFADLMLLSMALPNIIGGIIMAPRVKAHLTEYWTSVKEGKEPKAEQTQFEI